MPALPNMLTIGTLAERSGVRPSALRFYESEGLITSERTDGNQRRYARETLRRVAVIRAAQVLGLSLREIRSALAELPRGRTPGASDWERLSSAWQESLDRRIDELERLRDRLTGCIGCGCLSLESCGLFNPGDELAEQGPGAVRLAGGGSDSNREADALEFAALSRSIGQKAAEAGIASEDDVVDMVREGRREAE